MIGKFAGLAVAGVTAAAIGLTATGNSASALTVVSPNYGLNNSYNSNYNYSSTSTVSYSSSTNYANNAYYTYPSFYGGCGNLYGGYYGYGLGTCGASLYY